MPPPPLTTSQPLSATTELQMESTCSALEVEAEESVAQRHSGDYADDGWAMSSRAVRRVCYNAH
eukprot:4407957-Amphidinium_carterae.1